MSIINMSWCVRVRQKGFYVCSACENPLFSSNSKYKHGTPWPAFHSPINQNSLSKRKEDSRAYKVSLTNTVWRLSQWALNQIVQYVCTLVCILIQIDEFNRYHVANVEMVLAMSFLATVQVVRALVSEYLVTPWNLFQKVIYFTASRQHIISILIFCMSIHNIIMIPWFSDA